MKHFKLSKKLTLGQKIFVLMLTFFVGVVNLSPTTASAEFSINATWGSPENAEEETANACEAITEDLDTEVRAMTTACSEARLGGNCLQTLFQCNEDNMDSEECASLNSLIESSATEQQKAVLDEEKEELEALQEQKDAAQRRQDENQEKIDEMNEDIAVRKMERQALDRALEEKLQSLNQDTENKVNGIRTSMNDLQAQRDLNVAALADQQRVMNEFLTKERLRCKGEAREDAKEYLVYVKSCAQGRIQGCNLGFQSFIRNGNNSYADMAKAYERRRNKECLRVDSDTEFSIQYKAIHAQIESNKNLIEDRNNGINAKATELKTSLQLANAQGTLSQAKARNEAAEMVRTHEAETQRRLLRITALANEIKNDIVQVQSLQNEIADKTEDIKDAREKMNSSLNNDALNKLNDAKLNAQYLLNKAQEAKTNDKCPCSGAIRTISERSGVNFCETSSDETPTQDLNIDNSAE